MTDRPASPAAGPGPSWDQLEQPLPDARRAAETGGPTTSPDAPTPFPVTATHLSPADRLLAADPGRLPGYDPAPLADPDRPPAEYHALSAALGCPDLFLVDADPGPDQLRFAAELAAEAARLGERVLVVTPTPADADAVLARLAEDPALPAGRALARHEHPDRLPAASAARTARALGDGALAAEVAACEARLAALRAAVEFADRLRTLADARAAALARLDAEAQKLAAELEARRKERTAASDPPAGVRQADGKKSGVLGLFKGLFAHKPPADPGLKAAEEAVVRLEAEAARLAAERSQVEENYRAGRELLVREAAGLADALRAAGLDDPDPFSESAERAAAAVPGLVERAEADLAAARRRAADPGGRGPESAREALARVRVVVATLDAVGADPLTAPPAGGGPAFARLVLTDADRLNEPEFAHAARAAARWVLVGSVTAPRGRRGPHRFGRPALFRRLWWHLHREAWRTEAGRLVAALADADSDRILREPLADRPEIELRFALDPAGGPVLAEVAFPPTTPAAEAKAFLARELGEVRLSPCGPVHWHEAADRLTACWPAADGPAGDWVELAPGVREKVVGTGPDCRTAAVAFDRTAGWDRESAARWLADRDGPGPRTAALPRPVVVAPARQPAGVSG